MNFINLTGKQITMYGPGMSSMVQIAPLNLILEVKDIFSKNDFMDGLLIISEVSDYLHKNNLICNNQLANYPFDLTETDNPWDKSPRYKLPEYDENILYIVNEECMMLDRTDFITPILIIDPFRPNTIALQCSHFRKNIIALSK